MIFSILLNLYTIRYKMHTLPSAHLNILRSEAQQVFLKDKVCTPLPEPDFDINWNLSDLYPDRVVRLYKMITWKRMAQLEVPRIENKNNISQSILTFTVNVTTLHICKFFLRVKWCANYTSLFQMGCNSFSIGWNFTRILKLLQHIRSSSNAYVQDTLQNFCQKD